MAPKPEKKREVSVIERRLQSGSVFAASSKPIPLTEPDRWTVRFVNTEISESRLWQMQAEKGWVYADPADLAIDPVELGLRIQDGRIVRGTQGREILMKMPKADYAALTRLKEAENRKQTFGTQALKQAVVGAAQTQPDGSRGAEFLDRNLQKISVVDSLERVSLED